MGSTALTFRCSKCKVFRDYRSLHAADMYKGTYLDVTGRVKHGRSGRKLNQKMVEYRCRSCGHVGWTSHYTMTGRVPDLPKE